MLFETANQLGVFSLLVIMGVLFGIMLDISGIINEIINPRKTYLFTEVLKLLATVIFGVVFIITINVLDFLKVEIWHCFPIFLGLYLEKISISEFILLLRECMVSACSKRKNVKERSKNKDNGTDSGAEKTL